MKKKSLKKNAKSISVILNQQTPKVSISDNKNYAINLLNEKAGMVESFLRFCYNNKKAIGLASNQTSYSGDRISERFFAIRSFDDLNKWELIINPELKSVNGDKETKVEKCLTWPGKDITSERYSTIVVSYSDINGNKIKGRIIEEFEAQVWQHEINHLDGIAETVTSHTYKREVKKAGRNDPCPCGSGKKYKKCCQEN